jgi:hypothetical protein
MRLTNSSHSRGQTNEGSTSYDRIVRRGELPQFIRDSTADQAKDRGAECALEASWAPIGSSDDAGSAIAPRHQQASERPRWQRVFPRSIKLLTRPVNVGF